jgi:tetratricopeptide (TPR) repeat protein
MPSLAAQRALGTGPPVKGLGLIAVAVVLVLVAAPARADDVQGARRRFAVGRALFESGRYAEALAEFEAGDGLHHRPEFDYNIGQCLAKLGRYAEAADALERYLQARPDDPEATAMWREVARMRARPGPPPAPPSLPPPPPRRALRSAQTAAIALGAVATAALISSAVTGGLALSTRDQYDSGCAAGRCSDSTYDGGRNLAIATDVLLAVGVSAAVTAIVLAATSRAPAMRAALDGRLHF